MSLFSHQFLDFLRLKFITNVYLLRSEIQYTGGLVVIHI